MNGEFENKYRAIIKYIAAKYADIGKTQLYKIIFFLDVAYYKMHKKTLTGDTYIKGKFGPTPSKISEILTKLERCGSIKFVMKRQIDYEKKILTLLEDDSDALISEFNRYIQAIDADNIKDITEKYKNYTSKALMKETHNSIYHSIDLGDAIPDFMLEFYEDLECSSEKVVELREKYGHSREYVSSQ